MRTAFEQFEVWRLYADPPYWQSWIAQWRKEFGEERVIEWFTTRTRQMENAIEGYDTAIKRSTLSHAGQLEMERHIANACRREVSPAQGAESALYVITKDRPDSPNKIDYAMAGVLSWEARTDAVASGEDGQNPYLIHGVRRLGETE